MATNEPDQRAGRVIRDRREALDLTQEELGWIAEMSRNSVRNAEGAKSVEDKTIRALELALALRPGAARAGDGSQTILSAPAARALVRGLLRLREAEGTEEWADVQYIASFRAALSGYRYVMEMLASGMDASKAAGATLRATAYYISAEDMQLLRDEFGDSGIWLPARTSIAGTGRNVPPEETRGERDAQDSGEAPERGPGQETTFDPEPPRLQKSGVSMYSSRDVPGLCFLEVETTVTIDSETERLLRKKIPSDIFGVIRRSVDNHILGLVRTIADVQDRDS